ncbi:TauD/TfdA family dioxygenase [Nocardia sp. NPDC004582]
MKSVLSERTPLHPEKLEPLERRDLPESATRAIHYLAAEIAVTVGATPAIAGTLAHPVLLRHIDAKYGRLPDVVHEAMRPPATAAGVAVISRLPIDEDALGPTPFNWEEAAAWAGDRSRRSTSFELDIALLLLARCAGEPFGWHGQQAGRLVNNILPTPGHEHEQSGASSTALLSPHTEDAFHPGRANLLMLGCLRNPDRIATTVSSIRQVELDAAQWETLRAARLPILPDVSYGDDFGDRTAPPIPTVGGDTEEPTLRFDPAYTPLDRADDEFRCAYQHLTSELHRVSRAVALAPGELLLMDNDSVVHGRVPFAPRYDGTDRWLKRVNIHLPDRRRAASEAAEDGYGQRVVAPFRMTRGQRP